MVKMVEPKLKELPLFGTNVDKSQVGSDNILNLLKFLTKIVISGPTNSPEESTRFCKHFRAANCGFFEQFCWKM